MADSCPSIQEGKCVDGVLRKHSALVDDEDHAARDPLLGYLASSLVAKYRSAPADLLLVDDAILLYEEVLRLRPHGHPLRAAALSSLGDAHALRCESARDASGLQLAIALHRSALALRPPGDPERSASLKDLAKTMWMCYVQEGDVASLREAVSLMRAALDLTPPGHPDRPKALNSLALVLGETFDLTGDYSALTQAASLHREALSLRPPGHPLRGSSVNNLAGILNTIYQARGDPVLSAESIILFREALELRPVGHPLRSTTLSNLSSVLNLRFLHHGDNQDIDDAITTARESLQDLPTAHPAHARYVLTLAEILRNGFEMAGRTEYIDEAVALLRSETSVGDASPAIRPQQLQVLGVALRFRFEQTGVGSDLVDSVTRLREALAMTAEDNRYYARILIDLAMAMRLDSLHRSDPTGIAEVIPLLRRAADLHGVGHPDRSATLFQLGLCLLVPDTPSFDFPGGMSLISEAIADDLSSARERLRGAVASMQAVERALEAASLKIDFASREDLAARVLGVYVQAMQLLPRVANFGLDHSARLSVLAGSEELGRTAAARALFLRRAQQAVELLEEGRGVFWSQALRLRSCSLDVVDSDDRRELERIFRLLDHGSHVADSERMLSKRDQDLEQRRTLSSEAEAIILRIRSRPGLERFLLPPLFADMTRTLASGFIVLLFSSGSTHHALIIHGATKSVQDIELKLPEGKSLLPIVRNTIPRDHTTDDVRGMRLITATGRSELEESLDKLWICVVKPIVTSLGLKKATGRHRPRVWWVAAGAFAGLPLHAAGLYHSGLKDHAADYFVSSYVPTVAALFKARRSWKPIPRSALRCLLYGVTSDASGLGRLAHASTEVAIVRNCMEAASARVLNDTSALCNVARVRADLTSADVNVLHLACHGVQHTVPLKSSFILEDGALSIWDLMKLDLPQAALAFLSACQTAKGDSSQPDQAVHLAASMLFCGFRSVIATMWSMSDLDGPAMAEWVYKDLLQASSLDLEDVPYALDAAVERLRQTGAPPTRWAPFVHMGG